MSEGRQARRVAPLQTLERGLSVLELLAREGPLSVGSVAEAMDLHRSIVYRLLRTLEHRGFAERDAKGHYRLGLAMAALGQAVRPDLQTAALPELTELADRTGCTAFVAVPSGAEAITLVTVEPPRAGAQVVYRPGRQHPLPRGAPGLAILAALPSQPDEREEVTSARNRGYARTTGEVIPGLTSLAAPVRLPDRSVASVAIVFVEGHVDEAAAAGCLVRAAARLAGSAASS